MERPIGGSRPLLVEVVTATQRIYGLLQADSRRLTDIMNIEHQPYLMLQRASIGPITSSEAALTDGGIMQINKEAVVYAVPYEAEEPREQARQDPLIVVPKLRYWAEIWLPPFYVCGYVFVGYGMTDPERIMEALNFHFIPLTEAKVIYETAPERPWHRDLIVLNRTQAHIFRFSPQTSS